MNKINHSKYKNTAIIFELLSRQLTSDVVSGKDSPALHIIKKYFNKTELLKEYKLYQTLVSNKLINESKAELLLNTTLDISTKLNREKLRREKYNLIKEIRDNYNIEEFFTAKINNYSQYAAIYNLIESKNSEKYVNPNFVVNNKITILEHISKSKVNKEDIDLEVIEEYSKLDKGSRLLTYKILLEKFNNKYSDLSNSQKQVLKEYINNISNTINLKEFVNSKIIGIKQELNRLIEQVDEPVTRIKLKEVHNLIKPVTSQSVKDEDIVALLQYYQLINELKSVN